MSRDRRRASAWLALVGALTLTPPPATAQFTASTSPEPLVLVAGGGTRALAVTTDAPNWIDPIQYELIGLPAGVMAGPPQVVQPPFPPVTFLVSATDATPRGTYPATLVATSMNTVLQFPLTVVIRQPDFALEVVPARVSALPGDEIPVLVRVVPIDGFAGSVSIAAPLVAGVGFSPREFDLPAGGSRAVAVSIPLAALPGVKNGFFVGRGAGLTRTAPLTVEVSAVPDFALRVEPAALPLRQGESASARVTLSGSGGFTGPVEVIGSAPLGLALEPSSFVLLPGGSRDIRLTATPDAPAGPAPVPFRGTAAGIQGAREATLTVQVEATGPPPDAPDFALTVTPASLSLAPGGSGMLTLALAGVRGPLGPVEILASAPPGLAVDPAEILLPPGGTRIVTVTADAAAPAGAFAVGFAATAIGVAGERRSTATVTIEMTSAVPAIHEIIPPSLVAGAIDRTVRLIGENFAPGATVSAASPGVLVTGTRVIGAGTADVVVSVRADVPPGPVRLELTNPDGAVATGAAALLVYPRGTLSGPLAVTDAVIVAPRPWQIVESGVPLRARGLLATTGIGTIVGTWLLDGVPFERFTHVVTSGHPVELVTAVPLPESFTGEHRLELAIESPSGLPVRSLPFFQALESRTRLRVLSPRDDVPLDSDEPVFRWTLVPGASGYEIEVHASDASRDPAPGDTLRRRVTDTEWEPEEGLLRSFGDGVLRFRVRPVFPGEVLGEPSDWVEFSVPVSGPRSDDGALGGALPFRLVAHSLPPLPTTPASPASDDEGPVAELSLAITHTTSTIASELEDPPPLTRLQLSTQSDVRRPGFEQQATADLSGSQDLEDPYDAREESRNWLTRFGAIQGGFREEASIGFAPPTFVDQSELLTVVRSGGAVEAALGTPVGRLAYYRSVELSANGNFGGSEPDIDAAAYEWRDGAGRFLARAMLLRAEEPGSEFLPGGDGRGAGLLAIADFGPRLRLLAEAAGGEFDPAEGSFEPAQDGRAARLVIGGRAGTFGYDAVLESTGEGFVNPANRGFTPAGLSDRARGELSLRKSFGRASLSGTVHRVRGGIPRAAGDPSTTEDGIRARLDLQATPTVSLQLAGHAVVQDGDAIEDLGLPQTDRGQRGLDLGVNERVGPFTLAQTLAWQRFSDDVHPGNDQEVRSASASAFGAPIEWLSLSSHLSQTWMESPAFGTTRQLLISLQPGITLVGGVSIVPRSAWTRSRTDGAPDHRADQYQIVVRWSPPWAGAVLHLEIASDWNRSWTDERSSPPSFDRRAVVTLTLDWATDQAWGTERAPAAARSTPALAQAHGWRSGRSFR